MAFYPLRLPVNVPSPSSPADVFPSIESLPATVPVNLESTFIPWTSAATVKAIALVLDRASQLRFAEKHRGVVTGQLLAVLFERHGRHPGPGGRLDGERPCAGDVHFPDWPAHAIEPAHKTTATIGAAIRPRRRFMIPSLTPRASGAACLPAYDLLVGKLRCRRHKPLTTSGKRRPTAPRCRAAGCRLTRSARRLRARLELHRSHNPRFSGRTGKSRPTGGRPDAAPCSKRRTATGPPSRWILRGSPDWAYRAAYKATGVIHLLHASGTCRLWADRLSGTDTSPLSGLRRTGSY